MGLIIAIIILITNFDRLITDNNFNFMFSWMITISMGLIAYSIKIGSAKTRYKRLLMSQIFGCFVAFTLTRITINPSNIYSITWFVIILLLFLVGTYKLGNWGKSIFNLKIKEGTKAQDEIFNPKYAKISDILALMLFILIILWIIIIILSFTNPSNTIDLINDIIWVIAYIIWAIMIIYDRKSKENPKTDNILNSPPSP